jgi:hypothetical protein
MHVSTLSPIVALSFFSFTSMTLVVSDSEALIDSPDALHLIAEADQPTAPPDDAPHAALSLDRLQHSA